MSDTATVHVVDDDDSFRVSVGRLLRASGFAVRTFASGTELLEQVTPKACGCVLVDLQMPGLNGLDLQAALAKAGIGLPVVFLTGRGDIPSTVCAMRQGAVDFLEKRAPKQKLLAAIRQALDRDIALRAARTQQAAVRDRFATLTEREREVLAHVVRGKMNKEIAAELGIHERTVKLHRTAITMKVGVHSVAELTTLVREAEFFVPILQQKRFWMMPSGPASIAFCWTSNSRGCLASN
jgi:two-component system response regulator FixJ